MNIVAVLNPKSANGRTARVWSSLQKYLPAGIEVHETRAPGHAIELTSSAIREGARTIIAVGGDGTINEVVNGFFDGDRLIAPDAALGIIPHGTGSDLRRTLRIPLDGRKAAEVIRAGVSRPIDIARVAYTRMDGTPAARYSLNVTSFGMGGAVAARANRSSKALGGKVSMLLATLVTALQYGGKSVTLNLDRSQRIDVPIMNVAVGNGQFHGGGMWVCPQASLDDGLLDVTIIRYLSVPQLIRGLPTLYNGNIQIHPKVTCYRARCIEARAHDTTLVEIDGEALGKLPVEISVVPRAIRMLIP
jgi:YegS/Rv2252/BmrU family lipid kinase